MCLSIYYFQVVFVALVALVALPGSQASLGVLSNALQVLQHLILKHIHEMYVKTWFKKYKKTIEMLYLFYKDFIVKIL